MDAGGWAFSVLVTLLVVALVVGLIVWLVRNQGADAPVSPQGGGGGSAQDLLDRRLASGEIGEDEYRRLRTALSETQPPSQPPEPARP